MYGKRTRFVSDSTLWRGYGVLGLALALVDINTSNSNRFLQILLFPDLSQAFVDRSSSRLTFNPQSANSSNVIGTYCSALSFSLGVGHGVPGWSWGWWYQ